MGTTVNSWASPTFKGKTWASPIFAFDAGSFKEEQHPRDHGKFSKGHGGGATSKAVGAGKAAASAVASKSKSIAHNFSHEDFHILSHNLHSANSSHRKGLGQKITGIAKALPQLLKSHLKEEKEKAVNAVGALKSLATGKRPSPEQLKGLRQFSVSVLLSAAGMLSHGDPTGTVGHMAMALGHEFVNHTLLEHGAKFGSGAVRFAHATATGRGQVAHAHDANGDDFSPEDMKMLQDYLQTFSKVVTSTPIPTERAKELLAQHSGPKKKSNGAADMAMDKSPFAPLRSEREVLALDRRPTARMLSEDGDLHVGSSNISKATVNPYWGEEIPNCEKLGLDPAKKYMLLRHPDELAKAARTFNNLPILAEHKPRSAEDHPTDLVVGSTGTDAVYKHPYLMNSLVFWTKPAIDVIENGQQRELSCAYHYEPVMTPGVYEGQRYDGIMTNIRGNHVALVEDGRAGADVVVQDSAFKERGVPLWR